MITRWKAFSSRLFSYILGIGFVTVITGIFYVLRGILDTSLVTLLLLIPVGLGTALWGLGPGIAAALTAFLGFNYFFLQPYYTFTVHRPSDLVVLMVFLVVAVVISQLVGQAQAGLAAATAREKEATQLYEVSMSLVGLHEDRAIVKVLADRIQTLFAGEHLEISINGPSPFSLHLPEISEKPPRPPELITPIQAVKGSLGEIRLWRSSSLFSPEEKRLLQTFASQGALALERAALTQAESRAKVLEESDRLKSALLSSVSHELRTPLATIKAAASSLRGGQVDWDTAARSELVSAIDDEADHLNMLVGNLLDMSRIESGVLKPQRQWNLLSEIVEGVLDRMRHLTESHELKVDIPDDFPLVPVDFVQMEQVFTNLVSNSIKYAPAHTVIRIRAVVQENSRFLVQVSNQGPPVPEEHLERIFDKFYRVTAAERVTGTGLGLSICKGIVDAHGGQIWAENLPDGFAFNLALPLYLDGTPPPELPLDPEAV